MLLPRFALAGSWRSPFSDKGCFPPSPHSAAFGPPPFLHSNPFSCFGALPRRQSSNVFPMFPLQNGGGLSLPSLILPSSPSSKSNPRPQSVQFPISPPFESFTKHFRFPDNNHIPASSQTQHQALSPLDLHISRAIQGVVPLFWPV